MGLAKCAGTKISYNGTLPQSLSRYATFYENRANNRIKVINLSFSKQRK